MFVCVYVCDLWWSKKNVGVALEVMARCDSVLSCGSVLWYVAVCCSVLQCIAVCCSVL